MKVIKFKPTTSCEAAGPPRASVPEFLHTMVGAAQVEGGISPWQGLGRGDSEDPQKCV